VQVLKLKQYSAWDSNGNIVKEKCIFNFCGEDVVFLNLCWNFSGVIFKQAKINA